MDRLTAQEFRRLAEMAEPATVSLLMPTHAAGRETRQDPIRLKNLLGEAEDQLIAAGRRSADAREQLVPLAKRLPDGAFWAHQDEGLAAYALPGETLLYRVPFALPERVTVGTRCYLLPLVPIVNEDAQFHVLAISPKQVRLLEGTRHTARELDVPGWPDSYAELSAYIQEEPQLQFHTKAAPVGDRGERAAVFHSHPGEDQSSQRKQRLLEYTRLVDERVRKVLGDDSLPLILACDERLAASYREASRHPRLLAQVVAGNPDGQSAAELSKRAWEIMRAKVDAAREAVVARYHQAEANQRAAQGLEAVLPAAHEGRIASLLVASDVERWGRYDSEQRALEIHDQPVPGDEELLNLATVVACQNGAEVYTYPGEQIPEKQGLVAVFRY
jgi:hypothetical protein